MMPHRRQSLKRLMRRMKFWATPKNARSTMSLGLIGNSTSTFKVQVADPEEVSEHTNIQAIIVTFLAVRPVADFQTSLIRFLAVVQALLGDRNLRLADRVVDRLGR